MKRSSLFWGIILIFAGAIWLLDSTGVLGNIDAWGLIWPAFLIGLGVWILWGRAFRRAPATEHANIPLEGATAARVSIHHGAGRLRLHSGASALDLAEGDFGGGLETSKRLEGGTLSVKMSVPMQVFPAFWGPGWLDWSIAFNRDVPLALEVNTGASETRLELSELKITELTLKTGASSTTLDLPASAGFTRVLVESGAASINIRVPQGVAARIRARSGLSSINIDTTRFTRLGDLYQSADYDTAENKADIDIQTGVGSVDVR